MSSGDIVKKLWSYCHVLREDGMSYGDYVEQLTYLLFLKMADERTRPPYDHYRHALETLGNEKGLLRLIFNKSQNKCQIAA